MITKSVSQLEISGDTLFVWGAIGFLMKSLSSYQSASNSDEEVTNSYQGVLNSDEESEFLPKCLEFRREVTSSYQSVLNSDEESEFLPKCFEFRRRGHEFLPRCLEFRRRV